MSTKKVKIFMIKKLFEKIYNQYRVFHYTQLLMDRYVIILAEKEFWQEKNFYIVSHIPVILL